MPKITSIKISQEHTEIEYLETKQTQTVTSLLKDAMTPTPEFVANFASLASLANEICDGKLLSFKSLPPKKLRKNRKTCMDCSAPSTMVIEGDGYCDEHGKAKLTA